MRCRSSHLSALLVTAALAAAPAAAWAAAKAPTGKEGPGKLELSGAEHRMDNFEEKIKRMRGQVFKLGPLETETLKRISALKEKYPDDPKVQELFERARKAIIASKGEAVEAKPDWARFRDNAQRLLQLFADEGEKAHEAFQAKALATKDPITKAFPPPDPRKVNADTVIGRTVILAEFQYPENEFMSLSRQYCYVGSGARGYYYVDLSDRGWLGAYEAVRRYRKELGVEVPQKVQWTIIGEIVGLHYLVPQAGKKQTMRGQLGWLVEPKAIYIPGYTFAAADPKLELGGTFAGEERAEAIKSAMYTVKSIPDDATPERLVEIFSIAIRERNHKLYLDCIDPARRNTPKALSRVDYHWELHQHRFATFYVHVKIEPAKISVVQGFDASSSVESAFLTEADKEKIKKTSEPLVEQAEVKSLAYDERGRQYGSPKPHFLKRSEKKRWYITNFDQPF